MRRPDLTKNIASGAAGYVGESAVQEKLNKANHAPQGATIAQRRADSIRKQALGQIGGA